MAEIPTNEYFPETDDTGKVILFHIYVDTYLLTEDGGANQDVAIKTDSSDSDFIKIVTTKFRRNFISLLRSVTNSGCANLSADMVSHLFDEDGNLYVCDNYKKSAFALLTENNVKVSSFYTIDLNAGTITTRSTDKTCNVAYFTFKLRFKYKLLDFVVQFELGNGIYQDSNEYNQNDTTINGDLIVSNDITVNNNMAISKNLTVACNSTFAKNATVAGNTLLNGTLTVGDDCISHDVKVYGGDENDDTYIFWDASESILSVQGQLIVGSDVDLDPVDGISDSFYDVVFHGANGSKLTWKSVDDELELTSHLVVTESTELQKNVTIGTPTVGADLTIHGSDTSGNSIIWTKATDNLRIKGHLHVGEVGTGYTVQINSANALKYINWNPDTFKLQINGNICGGEECAGSTLKVWGNDTGKYILWDNSSNKLSIIGNFDVGNSTNLQTTTLFGSLNAQPSNLVWDGPNGLLTNAANTTLKGVTEIQNKLTVGVVDGNHQLLVYGDAVGKNLTWVDHKLSINGILDVLDKTTLNGELETNSVVSFKSDTVGKSVLWTNATHTLKITGITQLCGQVDITSVDASTVNINSNITLEKPVQINDTVVIGANESGYQFKVFGSSNARYMDWSSANNKLNIQGAVDILEKLTTTGNVCLSGSILANNIQWNSTNDTLDVNGIVNLNSTVNVSSDVIVENGGTLKLNGVNPVTTYIEWANELLTIESNVDMYNKTLQIIDSDLTIKSCDNDFCIKWDNDNSLFSINGSSSFSGKVEMNNNKDVPTKSVIWDGTDTLTCICDVDITNNDLTVRDGNVNFTDGENAVTWNSVNATFNIESDLTINYNDDSIVTSDYAANLFTFDVNTVFSKNININGVADSITWDGSLLSLNSGLTTNKNITINGSGACVAKDITWTSATGTLLANGIVKLTNANDTCSVEWNNTDKLLINSSLDISDQNGDVKINWHKDNNILTATDCSIRFQKEENGDKWILWNPDDKLTIKAPVDINSTLLVQNTSTLNGEVFINNNTTISGSNANNHITWVKNTDLLTVTASSIFNGDTTLGGCNVGHHVKWVSDTNLLTVTADSVFNGDITVHDDTNTRSITWNSAIAVLDVNATTVTIQGDNTHKTEWSKANNRLTVTGSLVKTSLPSDECGDVTLEMTNNNNFHLTLTGNINLVNPLNACAGQEGRIVIKTGAVGRTITYGDAWIFQNCIKTPLTNTSTFDVLVYYVFSSTEIFVRMESNYTDCPPPGC